MNFITAPGKARELKLSEALFAVLMRSCRDVISAKADLKDETLRLNEQTAERY
jgi:hypothetical protein